MKARAHDRKRRPGERSGVPTYTNGQISVSTTRNLPNFSSIEMSGHMAQLLSDRMRTQPEGCGKTTSSIWLCARRRIIPVAGLPEVAVRCPHVRQKADYSRCRVATSEMPQEACAVVAATSRRSQAESRGAQIKEGPGMTHVSASLHDLAVAA